MFLTGGLRAPGRFILTNISRILMPRTYYYYIQNGPFKNVIDYQTHIGSIS